MTTPTAVRRNKALFAAIASKGWLPVCLAWFLLYFPLLMGLGALPWDAADQFYPTAYFNATHLRLGIMPWWNPYIYAGFPQAADPQGMLFSPLLMAWMMLPRAPGMVWFGWGVLLHGLFGALCLHALLRRWDASRLGALVGVCVYLAGGVAASRLEHVPIFLAYGYLPLALLCLERLLDTPTLVRGLILGLVVGCLAVQLVQASYLFCLTLLGYGITQLAQHWARYVAATRMRLLFSLAAAALVTMAAVLPQLLTTLAFARLSNREHVPVAYAAMGSLDWRAFATLALPNALHGLHGQYTGSASKVEAHLYIGVLPLLLLLLGTAGVWRTTIQRRQLYFWGSVGALAAAYMLGTNSWFYPWLYDWLPGVQQFRRPSDAAYLFNFMLAIWVGLSASHAHCQSRKRLLAVLSVMGLWLLASSATMVDQGGQWLPTPLIPALAVGVAMWSLRRRVPNNSTPWVLALVLLDYWSSNLNGTFHIRSDKAAKFARMPAVQFLVQQDDRAHTPLPWRISVFDGEIAWDNHVMMHGLYSTQGYNPMRYKLYDQWYGARQGGWEALPTTTYNAGPGSPINRLLGVGYMVKRIDDAGKHWTPPEGFKRVHADSRYEVWRDPSAYPRVLTPRLAHLAPHPPTPLQWTQSNFLEAVWLTPRDSEDATEAKRAMQICNTNARATPVKVRQLEALPSHWRILTSAFQPGWLVLSEVDFPGWRVRIEGAEELPIMRANGMFRALCVPAGEHTLHMQFSPWAMVAKVLGLGSPHTASAELR